MDFKFFLLSTNFCQSYKYHTSASLLFIPLESPHLVWWLQSKPFNSVQSQTCLFLYDKNCVYANAYVTILWSKYLSALFPMLHFFFLILYLLLFSHCDWGDCFLGRKWQIHTAVSNVYVSYSAYLPAEQYLLLSFCQSLFQGLHHSDCLLGLCGNWISDLIWITWWNDRVNRLALNFHLLMISNDFHPPKQNIPLHTLDFG